jgi:hypothetical protein
MLHIHGKELHNWANPTARPGILSLPAIKPRSFIPKDDNYVI